ncbi:pilin [Nonomuraea sp. WAC 01424]|uniref:pilin n=1 Tax=Nonomuraea sp. WAC 01424 TaxID=2203200 RepID=UPI001C8B682A|nr:pilin [Nonomuraea sp. WAC 01424]
MTRPRRTTTSPQPLNLKICLIVLVVLGGLVVGTLVDYVIVHAAAFAAAYSDSTPLIPTNAAAAPSSLIAVIDNLRNVIVGLLVALATLFLTVGGVRYILAGGDPGEVEAAKKTLRYAALGYGIAVLAPLLVSILKGIVGA